MNSTDASTGKDGDDQFRNHAHIECNPVSRFYAGYFKDVCKFAYLTVKFTVGQNPLVSLFTFPDDGSLVFSPAVDMNIKSIVADICFSAVKPLCIRAVPFQHSIKLFKPVELFSNSTPIGFRIQGCSSVDLFILLHGGDMSILRKLCRRRKFPFFRQNRAYRIVFRRRGFGGLCVGCCFVCSH